MKSSMKLRSLLGFAILALLVAGCSSNPFDSSSQTVSPSGGVMPLAMEGEQVQFEAKVQTTDHNQRMLTFEGVPDTVVALQNCQIVRLNNENVAPVPFTDVGPGDTAYVWGTRQQNGYVFAHHIQVRCKYYGNYDLAFRDTISAIDYAAGTFQVAHHTQLIWVDSNTVIWGSLTQHQVKNQIGINDDEIGSGGGAGKLGPLFNIDTALVFTDLQIGDVVEVRANIIDSATLLAVSIKVANCETRQQCLNFEAHLASLDLETRLVTFDESSWIGWVCPGAKLIGLDGEALVLDDFATGDFVAVKGVPLTGDTLKISQMTILSE